MGFSTWRFWIKLVVLMGFIGLNSVAVYEVQAATSIGEVIVIDDRPQPANPINAPGSDILTPKPLKNNLPRHLNRRRVAYRKLVNTVSRVCYR